MEAALHARFRSAPSRTWAVSAGIYAFAWGVAISLLLSDLLELLVDVIGLPGTYWPVVVAAPALVVGTATWWAIVERRGNVSYLAGALFGVVTALLVGLLWTARFVSVWGVEMLAVPMVASLVAFVLGFVAVAGGLVGLPLLYARQRVGGRSADRAE